jgi:alkylhydroperoxidase/carboxymuconolactone decarboxylase family protein YurZ/quercetin dioxygenase-like cupin family protein
MKKSFFSFFAFILISVNSTAQPPVNTNEALDSKQQNIVAIAAFTAKGELLQLKKALNECLDAGLTVNETKEVLVQLYAYTGFPRSLNALNTLIAVLKERKNNGINDPAGSEASPLPKGISKLQFGTAMQTKLIGQSVKGEVYAFAPVIDQFLKEHLFGDIFGRDNLDWKTRELVTIAALAALGNVENQLRSHFNVGIYNGLTEAQLIQLVSITRSKIGIREGNTAKEILQTILGKKITIAETASASDEQKADTLFPKGEKITNNNFTGTAYLHQLILSDSLNKTQVGNVTFEPGARSNWHYHPGGQILLAIAGTGYYQEKGSPVKILRKGDVVKCQPNIIHWHGASADDAFIQVAITPMQNGSVVWLQKVTDKEYQFTGNEK